MSTKPINTGLTIMKIEALGQGLYRLHLKGSTYTITGFVACWRMAWELRGAK